MDIENSDILKHLDAYAAGSDYMRASTDNLRFDERVADARRRAWEAAVSSAGSIGKAHALYVESHINRLNEEPASFGPDNAWALIPAPARNQDLVRIEELDPWLDRFHYGAPQRFLEDVTAWEEDAAARRKLQRFLNRWNQARDRRPMFAAFRDELRDEVKADTWAAALRKQLGLAHLDASSGAPKVLALMQYRVSEVLDASPEVEPDRAFAAPTSLDSRLNPWFFPTPRLADMSGDRSYGAAVHLNGPAAKLVCEVLHRRIPYKLEHLKKAAILTEPLEHRTIQDLRNGHLALLRHYRRRPDFGEMMA